MPEKAKQNPLMPFMVVGLRSPKSKVSGKDCENLMEVLKKHMECDNSFVNVNNIEETVETLRKFLNLAS